MTGKTSNSSFDASLLHKGAVYTFEIEGRKFVFCRTGVYERIDGGMITIRDRGRDGFSYHHVYPRTVLKVLDAERNVLWTRERLYI